jgi:hypothetical protein
MTHVPNDPSFKGNPLHILSLEYVSFFFHTWETSEAEPDLQTVPQEAAALCARAQSLWKYKWNGWFVDLSLPFTHPIFALLISSCPILPSSPTLPHDLLDRFSVV